MQITPSLELCTRLKDLGYPQDGGSFYYLRGREEHLWKLRYKNEFYYQGFLNDYKIDNIIAAPAVEEMVGRLREKGWNDIEFTIGYDSAHEEYFFGYDSSLLDENDEFFHANTLSNSVAKACIWVFWRRRINAN